MYNTSMTLSELLLELHINYLSPLRETATDNNLSSSQLLCISSIPYSGITQTNLANKLSLDISTLSRNLSKMIKKGFIIKKVDSVDKRVQYIFLTDRGKDIYSRIIMSLEKKISTIYSDIDLDDIESLLVGIEKLNWQLMKQTLQY